METGRAGFIQKIGFYAATVQYLNVVILIWLQETIDSMVAMSDELGRYQQDQNKARNPIAAVNEYLIKSARTRIAKVVNHTYAIIDSLPADQRLSKPQLGEIFWAVRRHSHGLFNTFEIKNIAAGVGENLKKINSVIHITKLNTKHLENLYISTNKISNIITAMLQNNPAQLLIEIKISLDNAHNTVTCITNMVLKQEIA